MEGTSPLLISVLKPGEGKASYRSPIMISSLGKKKMYIDVPKQKISGGQILSPALAYIRDVFQSMT